MRTTRLLAAPSPGRRPVPRFLPSGSRRRSRPCAHAFGPNSRLSRRPARPWSGWPWEAWSSTLSSCSRSHDLLAASLSLLLVLIFVAAPPAQSEGVKFDLLAGVGWIQRVEDPMVADRDGGPATGLAAGVHVE